MPTDLLRRPNGQFRVDIGLLYPAFLERALDVLAECRKRGADFYPVCDSAPGACDGGGFRSFSAQAKLYFQGRTMPGHIVTNARGGYSAHNYGLALDLVLDGDMTRDGLQPDWNPRHYVLLGEVARAHGLVWGGDFKSPDAPHIQWPGYVTAVDLAPLRVEYVAADGGFAIKLAAVWAKVAAS